MLVVVGLWVRLTIEESPVFKEAPGEIAEKKQEATHMPILEVIRRYPRRSSSRWACGWRRTSSYYIFTVIVLTYIVDVRQAGQGPGARRRC